MVIQKTQSVECSFRPLCLHQTFLSGAVPCCAELEAGKVALSVDGEVCWLMAFLFDSFNVYWESIA